MSLASLAPQRQLNSVALRYRHALAHDCHALGQGGSGSSPARHLLQTAGVSRPTATKAPSAFHRQEELARLEAALFIAGEPLNARKIAHVASLADATEARTLIRRLNGFYDEQGSAFRVEQLAGGYQLLTRAKFGGWLRRLHQAPVETRLSAPAAETLAVVAYRQPVPRAEVESIRGVQCGEMLRQLMDRNLVRIVGRSPELGRPFLYGTTRRFLQWIGLRGLDELPRAELLRRRLTNEEMPVNDTNSAARRNDDLNPRNDLNEEPEVKIADRLESALIEPWNAEIANAAVLSLEPWASNDAPRAHAEEGDDVDEDDDFDDDDDDDDDYDDDDDDLDEDEDLDDEDLEDEEWEEVDDDDDWEDDDDDDDWEDDDDEEDEDDDWDEE